MYIKTSVLSDIFSCYIQAIGNKMLVFTMAFQSTLPHLHVLKSIHHSLKSFALAVCLQDLSQLHGPKMKNGDMAEKQSGMIKCECLIVYPSFYQQTFIYIFIYKESFVLKRAFHRSIICLQSPGTLQDNSFTHVCQYFYWTGVVSQSPPSKNIKIPWGLRSDFYGTPSVPETLQIS